MAMTGHGWRVQKPTVRKTADISSHQRAPRRWLIGPLKVEPIVESR
jgi:hypothetical protein